MLRISWPEKKYCSTTWRRIDNRYVNMSDWGWSPPLEEQFVGLSKSKHNSANNFNYCLTIRIRPLYLKIDRGVEQSGSSSGS